MGFTVDKDVVADFGFYLGSEAGYTLPTIEELARREGMSDHGFTGLLEPLGDFVNGDASVLVGSAFSMMQRKMCDLGDSVVHAANQYGWTDHSNASMFDRNQLGGDTDENVTFGNGYGDDGYENYTDGGFSKFHYTTTEISAIDRPDTKYSDDIDDFGPVLTVLDWIWSEFGVDGGKGFTDSIISPLAGNYKSIEANGEAWKSVGKNLGLLAGNMGTNATTLATQFWQGDASTAFKQFLDVYWNKGAVWAGEQLGNFVATGFDKIADASKRIAAVAIKAINVIIKSAIKIASKAIPIIGWAWTAIQSAAKFIGSFFGIDIDDLYDDIMAIVNMAHQIFTLFQKIDEVVKSMKEYFTTLEELANTIKQIPEIDNFADAAAASQTINDHKKDLDDQKANVDKRLGEADDALGKLEQMAADAEAGR